MAAVFLMAVFLIARRAGELALGNREAAASALAKKRPVICVDVGHGGNDPGKIAVDGTPEKDINLSIARKLKAYLEASDAEVILTREDDRGLYKETDTQKKAADMRNRCAKINEVQPDLMVSIHQNSYHQEAVSGGQVFYFSNSEEGKRLAEILQRRFDYVLGEKNTRLAKANGSYYLLKNVKCVSAIVECGFLSNWEETKKLKTEEYQDRLAWTIHVGIMEYLNSRQTYGN